MATLDISGVLQSMVDATTPDAVLQRNLALSMFSGRVTDVVERSVANYLETSIESKKRVESGELEADDAEFAKTVLKELVQDARHMSRNYHG